MNSAIRIADYADADFDPFATFDRAQGFGEVDDPYPLIHSLHQAGAVQAGDFRTQFGLQQFPFWKDYESFMVFGYDAVSTVYGDGDTYSNFIMQRLYLDSFGESINGMDAPEHPRYRRLFQKAFMPTTISKWGAELVPQVVNRIIDQFAGRGHAELVSEFSLQYPFHVIFGQLHLPPAECEIFHRLAVGLMCIGIDYPHAMEASEKMGQYFSVLLEERRKLPPSDAPDDDMITMLANAEVDGERLPDNITISFLRQLMNAAGDTTFRSTGSLLVGLLNNPDQLDAVRKDRSLIPQAIDEALRWDGPLTQLTRQASKNVVLNGIAIPAGAKIDVVQGSANRDPARFENPDKFDIFRKPQRNMAFAFGPHVCIGQHLAKLELTRALNGLFDRLPNLRLDPNFAPPTVIGLNSRTPAAVHVLFD
jgi:cytochrome P450